MVHVPASHVSLPEGIRGQPSPTQGLPFARSAGATSLWDLAELPRPKRFSTTWHCNVTSSSPGGEMRRFTSRPAGNDSQLYLSKMAMEIVSSPWHMVIFHSFAWVYREVVISYINGISSIFTIFCWYPSNTNVRFLGCLTPSSHTFRTTPGPATSQMVSPSLRWRPNKKRVHQSLENQGECRRQVAPSTYCFRGKSGKYLGENDVSWCRMM